MPSGAKQQQATSRQTNKSKEPTVSTTPASEACEGVTRAASSSQASREGAPSDIACFTRGVGKTGICLDAHAPW